MIDLNKIIDSQITFNADLQSRDEIKDCMKVAIREALELAARDATLHANTGRPPKIDKQSIMQVREKIK